MDTHYCRSADYIVDPCCSQPHVFRIQIHSGSFHLQHIPHLMMDQYQYTTIQQGNEIRLLKIEPGKDSDPISCSIEHFAFKDTPQNEYFALSYEWGVENKSSWPRYIFLNKSRIRVRENLCQALWHLRKKAAVRGQAGSRGTEVFARDSSSAWQQGSWIWIDAICVNQSDTRERNHQVRLMAQIYRNAKEVLVWLGRLEALSDSEELSNSFRLSLRALEMYRRTDNLLDLVRLEMRTKESNVLVVLRALLERPYWLRICSRDRARISFLPGMWPSLG